MSPSADSPPLPFEFLALGAPPELGHHGRSFASCVPWPRSHAPLAPPRARSPHSLTAPRGPPVAALRPRRRRPLAAAAAPVEAAPLPSPLLPPSAPVPCAVAIPVLRPVGARRAPPWSPTPLLRRSAGSARPCGAPERAGAGHRCARARSGDNRAAMRPKTARPLGPQTCGAHAPELY